MCMNGLIVGEFMSLMFDSLFFGCGAFLKFMSTFAAVIERNRFSAVVYHVEALCIYVFMYFEANYFIDNFINSYVSPRAIHN